MEILTIEKEFAVPIEKVWNAFVDKDVLSQWWMPEGMSNIFMSVDVKEGGMFRYCFKMNDGDAEFWGRGMYKKIEKPNYLSYLDSFTDADGNDVPPAYFGMIGNEIVETLVEFFFTTDGEKTMLKMVAENPFDEKMTADMTDGWNGMLNHLSSVLK